MIQPEMALFGVAILWTFCYGFSWLVLWLVSVVVRWRHRKGAK